MVSRPLREDGEISEDEEVRSPQYRSPLQRIHGNAGPYNWGMFYPPPPPWIYDPRFFQPDEEDVENDDWADGADELESDDYDGAIVSGSTDQPPGDEHSTSGASASTADDMKMGHRSSLSWRRPSTTYGASRGTPRR